MQTTYGKQTKASFRKLLKIEKPNLIIHLEGMRCSVSFDNEGHSKSELKRLNDIMNGLARDIWIDRTYVCFEGNRFKDAFINEERWYDLIRTMVSSNFGRKDKDSREMILECLVMVCTHYLYQMLEKYGYSYEDVTIEMDNNLDFSAEYFVDNRTSWNF